MKESDFLLDFWDYYVERRAWINNLTAKITFSLHGDNVYTSLTGKKGDISNLCQYKWYDRCYYKEHKERFRYNQEVMGQVLGSATSVGNKMAQWTLKSNRYIVPRQTLHPLHVNELHIPEEKKKHNIFGALIERIWVISINQPPVSTTINDNILEEHEDKGESARIIPDM